ncbi:hypothetical protein [Halothiobacillus diazotrophicus]|uniref:hypothetical protein n=1 Tax=Halothiobacillus diazotrophicus TaxID=1860122 RepID=UPI0012E8BCA1|nr:hypothetical protein [Halothiobacillus diazotrophicus]
MEVSDLFLSSSVSETSYANLQAAKKADGSFDLDKVRAALIAKGFSPTQAAEFVTQWRVVDHQPNTLTGLSATLFERLDVSGGVTGEFTLAVRGTEPFLDPE